MSTRSRANPWWGPRRRPPLDVFAPELPRFREIRGSNEWYEMFTVLSGDVPCRMVASRGALDALDREMNMSDADDFKSEDWRKPEALKLLPEREAMRSAIFGWIEHGRMPGDFLQAVLRNDMMRALLLADEDNQKRLVQLAQFFYNYTPGECYGSAANMQRWQAHGGYAGIVEQRTRWGKNEPPQAGG